VEMRTAPRTSTIRPPSRPEKMFAFMTTSVEGQP
jgi:hypothetical protein